MTVLLLRAVQPDSTSTLPTDSVFLKDASLRNPGGSIFNEALLFLEPFVIFDGFGAAKWVL